MTDATPEQLFESVSKNLSRVRLLRIGDEYQVRAGIDPRTVGTGETIRDALDDVEVDCDVW